MLKVPVYEIKEHVSRHNLYLIILKNTQRGEDTPYFCY